MSVFVNLTVTELRVFHSVGFCFKIYTIIFTQVHVTVTSVYVCDNTLSFRKSFCIYSNNIYLILTYLRLTITINTKFLITYFIFKLCCDVGNCHIFKSVSVSYMSRVWIFLFIPYTWQKIGKRISDLILWFRIVH